MTIALRQRSLARVVMGIVKAANGAWFDPSDLLTLYQDSAGSTPVTAVEQPVGKMLDKSGNGYLAAQSITASRPTLSARKNILLATETLSTQSVTTVAATYTLSFTGTGSVTLSGTATGTLTGNGTDRVSLTFTPTAGTLTLTVSGSVTKAQVELGSIAGPYQRVTTATDYDADERYFPKYLRFDGVDDYLNLPYMGLYANGSASVVAGLRSVDVAGVYSRILAETSSIAANQRYLLLREELNEPSIDLNIFDDSGLIVVDTPSATVSNGELSVISVIDSGSNISIHKNSSRKVNQTYTRGNPVTLDALIVGAQKTTGGVVNAFMQSQLYGLIITKSPLTDAQRIQCERHQARKSGVLM